ncbi:MAG: putative toxin-antitoxin system toxin component, PIN family [Nitrospira sp.]|nr:putative toxin-antitoxin system toxin component, PIN family [Nitrospira sp.]
MRVVFDTNIYISALILPGSSAHRAIQHIIDGHDRLLISKPILDEILTTLARKFSRDAEALSRTALWVTELAELIYPETRVHVFNDDPDNRVLECAIAGKAKAIVTGDKAMLAIEISHGVRILSLAAYLSR